ncbi:MAG: C40 family peptidase [Thermoleophilia bacterium]|nr:C40 family peptidase [Thermoleophilia bacterium]
MRASSPFDNVHDPGDPAWDGHALEPAGWRGHAADVRAWLPLFAAVVALGVGAIWLVHHHAHEGGGAAHAAAPAASRAGLPVVDAAATAAPDSDLPAITSVAHAAPTAATLQDQAAERLRKHALENSRSAPAATSKAPLNDLAAQSPSHGIDTGTATPHTASSVAVDAAWLATTYVGTPYVWAGGSPTDGFDCSGLVQFVYGVLGAKLPRTTFTMWNLGRHVDRSELRQGDLVFFNGLDHMGLYVGDNKFVHAPHAGDRVKITDLDAMPGWYGAVRLD